MGLMSPRTEREGPSRCSTRYRIPFPAGGVEGVCVSDPIPFLFWLVGFGHVSLVALACARTVRHTRLVRTLGGDAVQQLGLSISTAP
ncbi:hypothetical protein BD310DRAFT_934962 [Dichomitus squalens]|uniref:Uncharacterized protein n=1 Tax=Dichomitus squalens TaxID=114155 RepID=A0A4Q9PKX8_9APHY|nr:hypothetical protein BD310DRAFT_934962 [Dichomitus squalens]